MDQTPDSGFVKRRPEAERSHEEVITTHLNADFDALASMIAAGKLYPKAVLVFPGSQERNLRNFFLSSTSYLFNFAKLKQLRLDDVKRLILVDTRQRSRIGRFGELVERKGLEVHIYDHHPASEDDIRGTVEVIEPCGSTTALLTRIIRDREISISPDEATIMCLGIHEDTGSFTFSSTTPLDYEAAAWLARQGANHNIISDMLTRELTAEQVWLLHDLTRSAVTRVFNGVEVVITKVIREDYVGDFAVLVHKFMEMENLNVVFALAQMEDRVYVVARSRIEEVNAGEIALALGGGGHPQAASAAIKNKTLIQVERSLYAHLRSHIQPRKIAKDMMTSPVIHVLPEATVGEAANLMTRYNINVLLVIDDTGRLWGYVTRQVVEKAVFFGLGDVKVKEYMNIEVPMVGPDADLKEVQDLIIHKKVRVLPVGDERNVLGVITRTDLLSILVGEPVVPDALQRGKNAHLLLKKRSMAAVLKERLPRKIIQLLKELGHTADLLGYNAYLVGGMVRDVFLKRPNLDVDIVIEGDGIHFATEYAQHHDVRVRSHKKFGTAMLIFPDGFKVDVATARMEYYESPGAPPIVKTSSLKMDLYRRDFTINTLAIKLNKRHYGTLIDYFGAQIDIKDKVLRVLHNLSFVEDPTRVLRAIRFEQRFGFKIGKLTLSLIRHAVKANYFKEVSAKRLFLELRLILKEDDPIKAVDRMSEFELLKFISPQIQLDRAMAELLQEIKRVIAWYHLLFLDEPVEPWKVYWCGLTSQLDGKSMKALALDMGMTSLEEKDLVSQQIAVPALLEALYKMDGDNYDLYTLLQPYDTELLLYAMARANSEQIRRLLSLYFTKLKGTKIHLRGKDLVAMGHPPGPLYRRILDSLLEARLNALIKTREDEIRFVRERFGPPPQGGDRETALR
jgi:tRNA nucleotidyltransferase (CCA-adding enzyme)